MNWIIGVSYLAVGFGVAMLLPVCIGDYSMYKEGSNDPPFIAAWLCWPLVVVVGAAWLVVMANDALSAWVTKLLSPDPEDPDDG